MVPAVGSIGLVMIAAIVLQPAAALAASEAACREYAAKALRQYDEALFLKVPGVQPPAWSNDSDAHLAWCLLVDQALVTAEYEKREKVLAPYRSGQAPGAAPPQSPSGGASATLTGPMLEIDDPCTRYAKQAVAHQQLNQQQRCGFQGPRWDSEQAYHENWCRLQSSLDPAMAEHKVRVDMLVACQTPGGAGLPPLSPSPPKDPRGIEPLLVPGLVLALWHGDCGFGGEPRYNLVEGSRVAKNDWIKLRELVKQGAARDHSVACGRDYWHLDPPRHEKTGLAWAQISDSEFDFEILQRLPPGLLLAFTPVQRPQWRKDPYPQAFGRTPVFFSQTAAEGPLPGLKTYCAPDIFDQDYYEAHPECSYAWFETTNDVAQVDWSLVDRLPRLTVLGLKYTSNSDGDWLGNQRWKRVPWRGPDGRGMKLYDPACRDCRPPPGFVRVEAPDRGAPSGQGFVWFMKVTGPDITQ